MVFWLHEFKPITWLAVRSQYFTFEMVKCYHKAYSNIFFSCMSHTWNTLLGFLSTKIFQNLNAASKAIFYLRDFCFYSPFSSLIYSHLLSLSVVPCVLVEFIGWFGVKLLKTTKEKHVSNFKYNTKTQNTKLLK